MGINYIGAIFLIVLGLAIIIFKKNLIKIVMGMSILDCGINLLLITIGYRTGGNVPIFQNALETSTYVDPVPQALTLTSIVIGACVTALALALVIKINEYYGTIDADKVRRLNG